MKERKKRAGENKGTGREGEMEKWKEGKGEEREKKEEEKSKERDARNINKRKKHSQIRGTISISIVLKK